jgi:hypothetical protein
LCSGWVSLLANMTGLLLDAQGNGLWFQQGQEISSSPKCPHWLGGPSNFYWMSTEGYFHEGKMIGTWSWPLLTPLSGQVTNEWICTPYMSMIWCLIKHREKLKLLFTFMPFIKKVIFSYKSRIFWKVHCIYVCMYVCLGSTLVFSVTLILYHECWQWIHLIYIHVTMHHNRFLFK